MPSSRRHVVVTATGAHLRRYWNKAIGSDLGLLVFGSQLSTYKILDQLTGRGINWLTLRQRGEN